MDAWLHIEGDVMYGLYDYRATLFAFDVRKKRIVAQRRELGVGEHCWNALWPGPDGRIWGLTRTCVFAVPRDLSSVEVLASYESPPGAGGYGVMGVALADDGCVYFPNDDHLMRLRIS